MDNMAREIFWITCFTLIFAVTTIYGSSPPKIHFITRPKDLKKDVYNRHFKREKELVMRDEQAPLYHTKSDSMQLYSIAAKRSVVVQDKVGSQAWDHEYELSVTGKSRKYGKQNKFVTETVSYGKLKIRSEDNNQYICAKNNGEIVFKDEGKLSPISKQDDSTKSGYRKNRKTRKRCLFNWSFTNQMHIKLSVSTSRGRLWYLTVQNDVVSLAQAEDTTELEKSFIWLPAKSGKTRGKTFMTNNAINRPTRLNERSFGDTVMQNTCRKTTLLLEKEKLKCKSTKEKYSILMMRSALQKEKLLISENRIAELKEEIVELRKNQRTITST